ncbi:putative dehydrogenase [Vibrio nigripulchritudo SOn1]|uniref:Dehydrogenase n=1 Tax=Vibrio nigripulchritudo SOn1 TaxID=1238450 RepID=A0AAV2VXW6_9VIBR|nr:Gfo/Idh/MocA family oxidoreductase [Vibrio nigripulchritudo]CCO49489.1 putative dehydrogenase [Vibrio nigripulchritudo SOn1]
MQEKSQKVRWGIAGLGNIAQRFAKALTEYSKQGELYAVAARSQTRANEFGADYGCQRCFGSYEEMARDPGVDAVYVATVHPYHKPVVEVFLKHKKHVLVEKPAFTNVADWLEMRALAKENGVLLLEAMKTVAFPAYRELKSYLVTNQISLTSIEAGFGNYHDFDLSLFIFNPDLSGGATLDVGVYALWLYCDLCDTLGEKVHSPEVILKTHHPESKVDEDARFEFHQGVKGEIAASIVQNLPRQAILTGEGVTITIHDKWWNPLNIDITHGTETLSLTTPENGDGFEYEIDHFSELVLQGKLDSDILKPAITEQVLRLMEEGLKASGYGHLT